jgi:hypothetical protein
MSDRSLAYAIAEEFDAYLRSQAGQIEGPVFAVSLRSNPSWVELGVNIGREPVFDAARGWLSDEQMAAPSSVRWYSGDWDYSAEPFVSEQTQRHLEPLAAAFDEAYGEHDRNPSAANWAMVDRAMRRWHVLSNEVMALVHPLAALPCSADAIAWVEFESYAQPVEHAISMTRTNEPALLGRLFPHWRRLCDALDATDPETVARARELRAAEPPREPPTLRPQLQQCLDDCGFTWWDLAGWDGAHVPSDFDPELPNYGTDEALALAFVVADRIS